MSYKNSRKLIKKIYDAKLTPSNDSPLLDEIMELLLAQPPTKDKEECSLCKNTGIAWEMNDRGTADEVKCPKCEQPKSEDKLKEIHRPSNPSFNSSDKHYIKYVGDCILYLADQLNIIIKKEK